MKRLTLMGVIAAALLWRRQRRFEHAVSDVLAEHTKAQRTWMLEANRAIEEWMSKSVKAIERVFDDRRRP